MHLSLNFVVRPFLYLQCCLLMKSLFFCSRLQICPNISSPKLNVWAKTCIRSTNIELHSQNCTCTSLKMVLGFCTVEKFTSFLCNIWPMLRPLFQIKQKYVHSDVKLYSCWSLRDRVSEPAPTSGPPSHPQQQLNISISPSTLELTEQPTGQLLQQTPAASCIEPVWIILLVWVDYNTLIP